jgi:hypothetical protein
MGSRATFWVVVLPFISAYGVLKANEDPPVVRLPDPAQSLPAGNLATVPPTSRGSSRPGSKPLAPRTKHG